MAFFNRSATLVLTFIFFLHFVILSSCTGEKGKAAGDENIVLSGDPGEEIPMGKKENLSGGARIYSENCKVCHGEDGKKQLAGAKDLSISTLTLEQRIEQIAKGKVSGKSVMPGYQGTLAEAQIRDVAQYLDSLKK